MKDAGSLVAAEEATLVASDGYLGEAFALNAEGSRALVGVSHKSLNGVRSGSANMFVRSGSVWTEAAMLLTGNPGTDARIGYSGAIDRDGSRVLLGATGYGCDPCYDNAGQLGSAHMFVRSGSDWTEEATLLAADGQPDDEFGASVALSADGSHALVGATSDSTAPGIRAGSARVFVRSGSDWSEEATLLAAQGEAEDRFGVSVTLSADGSRALVGAPDDDAMGGTNTGSAHLFVRSGSDWSEEATLLATDGDPSAEFGASVALSADGSRALVGAWGAGSDPFDAGAVRFGSARVFVRSGSDWTEEATLLEPDAAVDDYFGGSVALSADGARALVGAWGVDTAGGKDAGSAHVFVRTGCTWSEVATLLAADGAANGRFGTSVALSADGSRALIGAAGIGYQGGRAYVFTLTP